MGLTPSFDPVNAKSLNVQACVQHELNLKCNHKLIYVHCFCSFSGNQEKTITATYSQQLLGFGTVGVSAGLWSN